MASTGPTWGGPKAAVLAALLALACTYRTDLLPRNATNDPRGTSTGGSPATGGAGGAGTMPSTEATASGGAGGDTGNDRRCTTGDDCVQCVYITTPASPGQCEGALGCCGGQAMNKTACAKNQAGWQANCANRGYTAPVCPCIVCGSPTCEDGECGFFCRSPADRLGGGG